MLIQRASGHVSVTGEPGETLETAVEIEDPTKSFVIYSELHEEGEAQYFKFEMDSGTRLRMTLMIPTEYASTLFRPTLVIMGPGLTNSSNISDHITEHVEMPADTGIMIFNEALQLAEYEGFTPSYFYLLEDVSLTVPETGVYYFAVYDETSHGRYVITISYRKTFTIDEWLLVPINVISIHIWEGQNLVLVLAPLLLTVVIGLFLIHKKQRENEKIAKPTTYIGLIGGLLIIGSGILLFYQMVWALLFVPANLQILITSIFGILPILLGFYTLRTLMRLEKEPKIADNMKLIVVAIASLFVWGGLLVGPVLLVSIGLLSIIQLR
ncbi:MAG: hypothetical protein P1Q69_13130 [Candidatus Thorarchaeota archaeon]|nr:hypothetical protein [Candidatus Thorarchaeota archaeon]